MMKVYYIIFVIYRQVENFDFFVEYMENFMEVRQYFFLFDLCLYIIE